MPTGRRTPRPGTRFRPALQKQARTTAARAGDATARELDRDSEGQGQRDDPALRKDRIIDVAIRLAEEGGFENVRQRDVALQAGVALGTLYKSFHSKEDILSAALHRETDALERRLNKQPQRGGAPADRLGAVFQTLTRAILKKPNYARAVLRAMTAGEEVAGRVVAHQVQVTRLVLAAMQGCTPEEGQPPADDELEVALLLQGMWFAALVGWSAGLIGPQKVVDQMKLAARLLMDGLHARRTRADTTG